MKSISGSMDYHTHIMTCILFSLICHKQEITGYGARLCRGAAETRPGTLGRRFHTLQIVYFPALLF